MGNKIKQPKWKVVEYSRNQIINAGKVIRDVCAAPESIQQAIKVVDNWRAAHAFPMHVIYMHLRRMTEGDPRIIVAERLKRLKSITAKLHREPLMNLWTMQDLGGCRVILHSVQDVYKYADAYEDSNKRHIRQRVKDYIKFPKPDGYRSLHVVYKYRSDKKQTYNNMLVEIQFRTHLQHLWATAVETMGLFRGEAIKSGEGSSDIRRFFVLVSALFAYKERQPLPPNVPSEKSDIIQELRTLNEKNNYLNFLNGIRVAVNHQDRRRHLKKSLSDGYCILILNYQTRSLNIREFGKSQIEEANTSYNTIESNTSHSQIDAVLVRVSSFQSLKTAYPNYFSDIGEFVNVVRKELQIASKL